MALLRDHSAKQNREDSAMEGFTEKISEIVVGVTSKDLTPQAIEKARQLFLDGIAVAVAGSIKEEPPSILAAHLKAKGAKEECSVIGFGFKTHPVDAAYINGSSMHVLDYEPMWSPANHAVSTNLPAILSLAEVLDFNGLEAATALVKGTETQGWLRQCSGHFDAKSIKNHPPGQVGPISSCVAAGHVLGFDAETQRHAFGIAASRCGALNANAGTMVKMTHCGVAVSLGLDAAMLASNGFTANPNIFEVDKGYMQLYMPEFDYEGMLKFGPPFRLVDPGYSIKMFPSQFGTHFVITAALEARKQIDDVSKIKEINLTTPVMHYVNRPQPHQGLAGKFSFQYTCCAALLDGEVVIDTFEDERRFAPDMEAMLEKVNLTQDENRPARFEEEVVDLEVVMEDGTKVVTRCDGPRGSWNGEPLEPGAHEAKVRMCLDCRLNNADAERIIELSNNLEQLENKDLREVLAIAAKPKS
ncbi:MAG TPA: MmgE/PrpD family protein [Rhodospirillaceae bacterium]|nr:MmgE/PrpD family protein [Rhodospirillaceae bacterium]